MKKDKSQQNIETIKIRQDYIWHFTYNYLENLRGMGVIYDDKFRELYERLFDYVNYKCSIDKIDGDIVDFYVIVEKVVKKSI